MLNTWVNYMSQISRWQIRVFLTDEDSKTEWEIRPWNANRNQTSNYYTWNASINCCKKTFYCNDHTITEFGIIDSKNSSTAYVILYELIDTWFLDLNRRVGVWSLPWRWHILSIPLTTGRGTGAETCGWIMCVLLMTFVPVQKLCVNKYIYIYIWSSIWVQFSLVYQLCLALWW